MFRSGCNGRWPTPSGSGEAVQIRKTRLPSKPPTFGGSPHAMYLQPLRLGNDLYGYEQGGAVEPAAHDWRNSPRTEREPSALETVQIGKPTSRKVANSAEQSV